MPLMVPDVHATASSRAAVAQLLAEEHRKNDPDLQRAYLADDPNDREIRLVEVSGSVGVTWQVLPFRYAARPDLGIPYPCVIVLLSPEEWAELTTPGSDLTLPASWGTSPHELHQLL
jgi:hypothetical protein